MVRFSRREPRRRKNHSRDDYTLTNSGNEPWLLTARNLFTLKKVRATLKPLGKPSNYAHCRPGLVNVDDSKQGHLVTLLNGFKLYA